MSSAGKPSARAMTELLSNPNDVAPEVGVAPGVAEVVRVGEVKKDDIETKVEVGGVVKVRELVDSEVSEVVLDVIVVRVCVLLMDMLIVVDALVEVGELVGLE